VSSINSSLYFLAVFLKDILKASMMNSFSQIKNSYQLTEKLNGFRLDPDFSLASLDVTSLFTNVPIDLALESITTCWDQISHNTSISMTEFHVALKFVLNSTFSFNTKFYKQIHGTPMGSLLSPIIADRT